MICLSTLERLAGIDDKSTCEYHLGQSEESAESNSLDKHHGIGARLVVFLHVIQECQTYQHA